MSLANRLPHTIVIERMVSSGTADGRTPATSTPTDIATVKGWLQPRRPVLATGEQATLGGAGVTITSHVLFLLPTDIRAGDLVRKEGEEQRYEVVGPPRDAGGRGKHLELDVQLTQGGNA